MFVTPAAVPTRRHSRMRLKRKTFSVKSQQEVLLALTKSSTIWAAEKLAGQELHKVCDQQVGEMNE